MDLNPAMRQRDVQSCRQTGSVGSKKRPIAIALLASTALLAPQRAVHAQAVNAGEVSATAAPATAAAAALRSTNGKLTKKKILKSTQSETVLGRRAIEAVGPAAGAAQILSVNPGVAVRSYGGISGSARYEIAVRGVKLGWSSVNGDAERNGLTALFDGIPMNNLISHNGQWDSNEIPIPQMLAGVNLIYGPGNPATRWFDSIGGTIDFIPVQPSTKFGGTIGTTFGSDGTLGTHFTLRTGLYHGWSGVLAGGYSRNDTFRTGSFNAPTHSYAFFGKVVKTFADGTISFGGYADKTVEYRPNFIPLSPIAGITTQGLDANAPLYSQSTSGYYSSLDKSTWFKQLTVQDYILYSKLSLDLGDNVVLHNKVWYRYGHRIHYRINNYVPGNTANSEYYNPTTNQYGDRAYLAWQLPYNLVKAGGGVILQRYVAPYAGYNDQLGFPVTAPSQFDNFTLNNTYLSAFIQDTISPIPALKITPGLNEVEYQTQFNNTGLSADPNPAAGVQDTTLSSDSSHTFTELEPSVGASYALTPWATVYGSYAVSYQNPTDNAFGANISNPGAVDYSTLHPIKSVDYEAGVRFLVHKWAFLRNFGLNVNFYHDQLTHETIATYLTNYALTKFASADATLLGSNITITDDPTYHWHLLGNIALNNSYYNSYTPQGGGTTLSNFPVSYSPKVIFTAGVFYRAFYRGVLISPRILDQYTGSQYLFSNLSGAPTRQSMPGYNVVNIGVDVKVPVHLGYGSSVKALKVSAGIANLLGTRYNPIEYITSGGYFGGNSAGAVLADPGAPRQFFITLSADF
ncbi:MAG: TonB-dependent receptor [Proteobacteria bacterium]|nr:TonB-dependent receptor [Pseudomonadota bacterium]